MGQVCSARLISVLAPTGFDIGSSREASLPDAHGFAPMSCGPRAAGVCT